MVYIVCFFKQKTAYEMRISDWSSDVCSSDLLEQLEIAVTVADTSKLALRAARKADIDVYRGDILDEVTHDHLDMKQFQQLVAATDNDAYNALICADLGPEIGFESVSQIGADRERGPVRGSVLMPGGRAIEELLTREAAGWPLRRHKLNDSTAERREGKKCARTMKE